MVELLVGAVFAGYQLEGLAGRGGMGVVYRVRHLRLDRVDALKVIAPEYAQDAGFRARFERESRVAAGIEHPHVIQIYHAGEEDGRLYLAMRYVEGTDLRAELSRCGRLETLRAVEIVAQIGSALDAAHQIGLVHRDVKPANVLVTQRDGRDHVYLTDFGLTKHLASRGKETRTGMFVGTTDYIAPEQVTGGPLDARADVYSLGCVLYHLLAGRVPYPRGHEIAAAMAHVNEPPPSLHEFRPDLSERFDPVISTAMAKGPAERYGSAGELADAAQAAARLPASSVGSAGVTTTEPSTLRTSPPDKALTQRSQTEMVAQPASSASTVPAPMQRASDATHTSRAAQAELEAAENKRADREKVQRNKAPPAGPATALSPPNRRPRHQVSRSQILVLAVGVVAVAIAALLLSRSGPSHTGTATTTLQQGSRWQTLKSVGAPLQGAGVAAYGGSIWVVGGLTKFNKVLKSVQVYHPEQRSWLPGPSLPVPLEHPAVVADKRYLYVIGGFTPGTGAQATVWRLDSPNSTSWRRLDQSPLPGPRTAGAAAWDGHRIVFAGGDDRGNERHAQKDVWALEDGENWKPIGQLQHPREQLAAAGDPHTGTVWFVGGSGSTSTPYPDVDAFTSTGQSTDKPFIALERAAAVGVGSGFCIIGGTRGHDDPRGEVACRGTNLSIPALVPPRANLGAAATGGKVYVVGGYIKSGDASGSSIVQGLNVPDAH
jgi:serine/threonine protein kinase